MRCLSLKPLVVAMAFLVLEATMANKLGAMYSNTKHFYGMPQLYPWDINALFPQGLCSDSSLIESVHGIEGDCSPEQITAIHNARLTSSKDHYHDFKAQDQDAWRARQRGYWGKRDLDEKHESARKVRAKNKA